jgi:glycosyltransferase involved in cell wall biosynthesis
MNILHISNADVVGGRFTGYYMREALGPDDRAEMAVWNRSSQAAHVNQIPPVNAILRACTRAAMRIDGALGFDGLTGTGGWSMPSRDYFKRADVVHLHLIHNNANVSLLSLPRLSRLKPLVWTLHDPWALTGGCEHSFECERWLDGCAPRCPHPRRRSLLRRYLPWLHWRMKRNVYRRSDITLIAASEWMKERIGRSPLVRHLPCHHIPFGIDLSEFAPRPKAECRQRLGIPPGHKVIAFRDVGLRTDRYKGMRYLLEALRLYEPDAPTCLLVLDDGEAFEELVGKYIVLRPGWVDGARLAEALSAADVFAMPSLQEAFGLMAVEAMACGTPVVVFEGTALPGVVRSPVGGVAVRARDTVALAAALARLLNDDELRAAMGRRARELAESEYSLDLYVRRHRALYDDVIARHAAKGDGEDSDRARRGDRRGVPGSGDRGADES